MTRINEIINARENADGPDRYRDGGQVQILDKRVRFRVREGMQGPVFKGAKGWNGTDGEVTQ